MTRPAAFGILLIWLVALALFTGCGHRGPLTPPGEKPRGGAWERP